MPQLDVNNMLYVAYLQFVMMHLWIIFEIKREEQFIFIDHLLIVIVLEMLIDLVSYATDRKRENFDIWAYLGWQ
jgi:hypothetical protein